MDLIPFVFDVVFSPSREGVGVVVLIPCFALNRGVEASLLDLCQEENPLFCRGFSPGACDES